MHKQKNNQTQKAAHDIGGINYDVKLFCKSPQSKIFLCVQLQSGEKLKTGEIFTFIS